MSERERNIEALLQALSEYGQKNPGQWIVPGWDGDSIARAITQAQPILATQPPAQDIETVDLVGIKNGVETNLGKVPMPPKMKLKEIARSYFGGNPEDDSSDAALMVGAGMEFFDWLQKQGYGLNHGADGNHAVFALRRAMDDAGVPSEVRAPLVGHFCNHWNHANGTSHVEAMPARLTRQEWDDAYSAFVGAFNTPLARRQIDNEFAQDARRRLSALNERIVATQPKGVALDEESRTKSAIESFRGLLENSSAEDIQDARKIFCDLLNLQPIPSQPLGNPVASLWVHRGIGMNGQRLHTVDVLDWSQLPDEGTVNLHLGKATEVWRNGCDRTAPAALRYLAQNERPRGGEELYNSAHLLQIADEIESTARAMLPEGKAGK